jgi:hypothetical protein
MCNIISQEYYLVIITILIIYEEIFVMTHVVLPPPVQKWGPIHLLKSLWDFEKK